MPYSPGWSVIEQMVVRRERWPGGDWLQALPLVSPGQEVQPDQPVMRLLRTTGPAPKRPRSSPLSISGEYGAEPSRIETSPAGLRGRVIDVTRRGGVVIESRATLVAGAIGAGKQVAGVLVVWQPEPKQPIPPGAILIVPGPVDLALLSQALRSSVAGVVASSISLPDFEGFLRTDLIQLISSADLERAQAQLPPLTLLLTEGLGAFPMPERTLDLCMQYQGTIALLTGATSVRLGAFPELVISLPLQDTEPWQPVQPDSALVPGALVRVCGGDYEGLIGVINYLFVYQHTFPTGLRARAARIVLDDQAHLVVPLSLLQRIG